MTITSITLTGTHTIVRLPEAPVQEIIGKMSFNGELRVSAVECPRGYLEHDEAPTYHVLDLVTNDEVSTDDRDEAVAAFVRFCEAAVKSLRGYTLECAAPAGVDAGEALAAYLSILNMLFGDYSIPRAGRKYDRIVGNDSAFAFVDKATGELLKCDGWKRPSRTTYGNLTGTVTQFPPWFGRA